MSLGLGVVVRAQASAASQNGLQPVSLNNSEHIKLTDAHALAVSLVRALKLKGAVFPQTVVLMRYEHDQPGEQICRVAKRLQIARGMLDCITESGLSPGFKSGWYSEVNNI